MSLHFDGSTGYLHCVGPIKGQQFGSVASYFPWAAGMWVKQYSTAATYEHFSYSRTINVNQGVLTGTTGGAWWVYSEFNSHTFGTVQLGWNYWVLRQIDNTNLWIDILQPDGTQQSYNMTDVLTDTSGWGAEPDMALGARANGVNFFDGEIAGFFYARSALGFLPSAAIPYKALRQMAYGSPFSIASMRKDILEYRSFRSRTSLIDPAEVYVRKDYAPLPFTMNGTMLGGYPQPPQASGWIEPWNTSRVLPVYVPDTPIAPSTTRAMKMGLSIPSLGLSI